MSIDQSFLAQFAPLSAEAFQLSADVTYIVDSEMRLRGYNQAWTQFALDNDGAAVLEQYSLGRSILDGMSPEPRAFYTTAYRRALDDLGRFEQRFECPSSRIYRKLHQSVYPLANALGLVITNRIVEERPMDRVGEQPSAAYQTEDGLVVQCCHCRCVANQTIPNRWDWVPSWVDQPPTSATHTFCPPCGDFYYGASSIPPL